MEERIKDAARLRRRVVGGCLGLERAQFFLVVYHVAGSWTKSGGQIPTGLL